MAAAVLCLCGIIAVGAANSGGYFKDIPFLDNNYLDNTIVVSEEEAIKGMKDLSRYEGICGGISSGANLVGAIKLLENN